jgi:hypothetical protein
MTSSWLFYDFFRVFTVRSIVGANHQMALALEKRLCPALGRPETPSSPAADERLNITVIFTSVDETSLALKKAGELASRLAGRITLVVPQVGGQCSGDHRAPIPLS